jgi:Protein of unknown function (DUF3995)
LSSPAVSLTVAGYSAIIGLTFEKYITFIKMLTLLTGLLLFLIFIFLSAIHFYWGLGGKWGADAAIPTKENNEKIMNPKLFECFAVAFGLLGFGFFILVKSQILSFKLPNWLLNYGGWALSVLFILRAIGDFKYVGFFKKIKNTRFGKLDTKYYSPLCLAIGLMIMILSFNK